jgi:hypothetical protein
VSKERKSTVLLEHHLKQLKLPTMLKEYSLLAKSCSQGKCDYPTYLLRLCEKEIADELGYVPFSKAGSELLFEVVSRAYERQSLIVTTNLPFENWTEVCGSERLTGAMLDRLTHRVHIIEANGASYRLEQSRKRLARRQKRVTKN